MLAAEPQQTQAKAKQRDEAKKKGEGEGEKENGMSEEDMQLHVEKFIMTEEQGKVHLQLKQELKKNGLVDVPSFCSDEEITRFCKARNFDFKKAYKMMSEAVEWRRKAKPQNLMPKMVEDQSITGKTYVAGKDKFGRPVVVMDSSCENSTDHNKKIEFLLFNLEYAKKLMEGNVDKWVLWIYLDNFSFWSAPPMKTGMETNRCLMLRYPERMGHCFLYKPPTLFGMVWKMASPLIDPRTKKKIHFMHGNFDQASQNHQKLAKLMGENWRDLVGLDAEHSKTKARGYEHKTYWKQVQKAFGEEAEDTKDNDTAASENNKEEVNKTPQTATQNGIPAPQGAAPPAPTAAAPAAPK
eukprot:CAMPEP_0197520642 /NCGR_PEP_ID=MMETSP1318-20131121/5983_1 /TAXON_ID=552666 /ORGANISM="Partenskyella glossopodia, Strain RCC365" /LENGTH=352 /DNA_ID=CAMNT_0043072315 /DNA_START=12 /DNA_END=1070 /DNA_ORIENTATION=+